ncbi:inositol 1,4,5-triphosphate receptor associated 1 isoform X2 [Osmerus eperlanus]|uniref:inositol 1,4,5-triphosphate receptor associated 1 isoform X2 n=1 Tax=Osmerus eperlanus TaxID=29151 RepID=UPI002E0DC985
MGKQPAEGTSDSSGDQTKMPGSEDSDEESSQEEQPVIPWNELSILERVGLDGIEMSEDEVETAFSQIALAFSSDQYTLKQRLQAEEHARNLAEENIQLELTRGRETLETLKDLCLDMKRSTILQRLELCLDILGGTVARISNTAEVLGAVHKEARVSRAVELMVAHVENLRRRHDRDMAELEETKKLIQKNPRRHFSEARSIVADGGELKQKVHKKNSQQSNSRRRVSVSVLSKQEKKKRDKELRKQSMEDCSSRKISLSGQSEAQNQSSDSSSVAVVKTEDGDIPRLEDGPPTPESQINPRAPDDATYVEEVCPSPAYPLNLNSCSLTEEPNAGVAKNKQNNCSPLNSLRHRRRGKTMLERTRWDKDKKGVEYRQLTSEQCGPMCIHRPLAHWLYSCRWLLLCVYLCVFCCVITLTVFFWNLLGPALW